MGVRFVAGFVIMALFVTAGVPCAGWQGSPEARHDCCEKGTCPSMLRKTVDHGDISQEAADQCCARSEEKSQRDSSQLASASFAIAPVVIISTVPHAELVRLDSLNSPRLDHAPPAPASIPLHVFLSVFLV